jgi:type IV pilus assembly protein PilO
MGAFLKMKWIFQVAIVAGVCGAVLGATWYWVFAPMSTTIASQTGKLTELQNKVDKSLAQKARFAEFKKEALVLQARLEELKKDLPLDKETEQLLTQVQASAREAGLRIQLGVFRPLVDREAYTEWPLEMEVVGTYHNLGQFLERIRRLPRIVHISKLRLQSRASEGDGAMAQVTVGATYEAKTFVYREEPPTATAVNTGAKK